MPTEPTNAEVLASIENFKVHVDQRFEAIDQRFEAIDKQLEKLEQGQAVLFDEIKILKQGQQKIVETLGKLQDSQHQRDLGIVKRVEQLEQGAAA